MPKTPLGPHSPGWQKGRHYLIELLRLRFRTLANQETSNDVT